MERRQSIVAELEGTLLRDSDLFPYFMLIAFEASGLLRFIVLLLACPIIRLLDLLHLHDYALRLMVFVAVAGIRVEEIEAVARAVLPKFYVDGLDGAAWGVFSLYERRVVVTRCPRLMVEWFAKEYLRAYEVVGAELEVNRFGYATGLMKRAAGEVGDQVMEVMVGERPDAGMGREGVADGLLASCKEQLHPPYEQHGSHSIDMPRVIFHDSRLVHLPTPLVALTIILYIPFGIMICATRIIIGLSIPIRYTCLVIHMLGGVIRVRGRPPPPASSSNKGVLFVCTHRSLMDPVVLATVLGRRVPAVTYSISRLSEIISPIPTVRLTRNRHMDAERIKAELEKGDVVVCPEGTTCREPFLLRFSGLFAELTDRIVPVAANNRLGFFHATTARGWKAMDPIVFFMNPKPSYDVTFLAANNRLGFFHATTARGWKAMDPIVFFMNPKPSYDVTFLDQLPLEATYAGGKSPHDVANYVQRILAETLGFECTNLTRKDKYRALVGHDGRASFKRTRHTKSVVG